MRCAPAWARVAGIACAGAGVAAAAAPSAAAVDAPQPGWTVLHCGVAKGVLYLTYAQDGQAAITPAVDNRAVRTACAKAGYPLAGGAPGRTAVRPPVSVEPAGGRSPSAARQQPQPSRVEPSFTAQAVGSSLTVDGRNDGDAAQSCLVDFAWTWDGNSGAPQSSSTQITLAGHQSSRVVSLSAPGFGARFVAAPRLVCRALE